MAESKVYATVLLETGIDKHLEYSVPPHLMEGLQIGMRVKVPIRGYPKPGFILSLSPNKTFPKVQPILETLSDEPLISGELLELARWMAGYYATPLRQVIKHFIPSSVRKNIQPKEQLFISRAKTIEEIAEHVRGIRPTKPMHAAVLDAMLKAKKGLLLTELLEISSATRAHVMTLIKNGWLNALKVQKNVNPLTDEDYFLTRPKELNPDQASALKKIVESIESGAFHTHLLHGVTGSGKTEVYLQAIDACLRLGKGVLFLVPEISLTLQTVERLKTRFENKIAILHSGLSDGERYATWHKIKSGAYSIVIGARSAIFSPVVNLGLIIIDEEHDSAYKQGAEQPSYSARDVAVVRGKMTGCTVVLASATPSIESYYNATCGKYLLSTLKGRAQSATLPSVSIVSMQQEYQKNKGFTPFSALLLDGIKKRFLIGEQTILFLNRRGYHSQIACETCLEPVKCPKCDLSLTFHKCDEMLSCHLCHYTCPKISHCPSCRTGRLTKFKGMGTELVEKSLNALFPDIPTLRMDKDTTRHKGSSQKAFRHFATGKASVLIGTQMIAKGLHFPQVTLVGVLNCDASLQIPDFRASETTFQLITQVAGRAGRGAMKGEVILQTSNPDNPTLQLAKEQDYEGFFKQEITIRQAFQYPPFRQLAKVTFSGKDEKKVIAFGNQFRNSLIPILSQETQVMPLVAGGHKKINEEFRYQCILRSKSAPELSRAIFSLRETFKSASVKLHVDINPLSTYF